MTALVPISFLPADIQAELAKAGHARNIGDTLLSEHGDFLRITAIRRREHQPETIEVVLDMQHEDRWFHYGELTLDDLRRRDYLPVHGDYATLRAAALAAFVRGDWDAEPEPPATAALMRAGDKQHLHSLAAGLEDKRQRAVLIQRIVEREVQKLHQVASGLASQLSYVHRVIGALELYLGVYEEVVLIADGPRASSDEPTYFFQRVLYMDEEAGITETLRSGQAGIDFQSIDEFDRWLVVNPANLTAICPMQKCIVALRPSRQQHHYTDDRWVNARLEADNRLTYLVIRNGNRVARLYTSTDVGDVLFPTASAMHAWRQALAEGHSYEATRAKDADLSAKTVALLLQGICDRTDLLQPLPAPINLLDPTSYERGHFRLIRDAEDVLPDSRLPWRTWQTQINVRIGRGSRVVIGRIPNAERASRDWRHDRFLTYMHEPPAPPASGVYTVDTLAGRAEKLVVRYNPGDVVYGGWGEYDPHRRKNRLAFEVYLTDLWLLNYDQIDLADIEFYLQSRINRRDYLTMLPLLAELRRQRLAELAWKREFVTLVAGRQGCAEANVWAVVEWWKNKTLVRRPLMADDAKALRMIEARVCK